MEIKVSASTNPPKTKGEMLEYISSFDKAGADYVHCDVMDGKFVRSKTFDYRTLKDIKKITEKPLDVHLMVDKPNVKKYVKNGANIVTVHLESFKSETKLIKTLQLVRKMGAFAGITLKPSTPIEKIFPYLYFCDLLLIMSVEPGMSGQKFMEETYERLVQVQEYLKKEKLELVIEVDGGVNDEIAKKLVTNGATMFVFGNYLYSSNNLEKAIEKIHNLSSK